MLKSKISNAPGTNFFTSKHACKCFHSLQVDFKPIGRCRRHAILSVDGGSNWPIRNYVPTFIRPLGIPPDGKHTCVSFCGLCTQAWAAMSHLFIFSTHTLRSAVRSRVCGPGYNPTI